jgi:SAM-dependent methyltransferase
MSGTDDATARAISAYPAITGHWDASDAGWYRPVGAALVGQARLTPGMRVLDAGCSAGGATIPAARAVSPYGHVTGIDLAEPMLDRARQYAAVEGLDNVTLLHADAAAPSFPPRSLDAVLANLVVSLLSNPAEAMARWRELLRPGGRVAFSWVLAEDPAWETVYDGVDEFVPPGRPTWRTTWRRWTSVIDAQAILEDGYDSIVTTIEQVATQYASPAHWWESARTQDLAPAWQHVPPSRRAQTRDAAFEKMARLRGSEGTFTRVRRVGYTTASAAPRSAGRSSLGRIWS